MDIVVTVGEVEVCVFEKGGAREDDVGAEGGVGHELIEYDGEEVFAMETFVYLGLIGGDGGGVGIVIDHRLDRRVIQFCKCVAELSHVDEAGGRGLEVETFEGLAVKVEGARSGEVDTTADVLELAREGGERNDGLDGATTTIGTLNAIVDTDDSGLGGGEFYR